MVSCKDWWSLRHWHNQIWMYDGTENHHAGLPGEWDERIHVLVGG